MARFSASFRVLGILTMLFSLTLLLPTLVALIYDDGEVLTYLISLAITAGSGFLIWLTASQYRRYELTTRDGFLITSLFWTVLGFFGATPFLVSKNLDILYIDAVFESMSGLTTTGATVITGLDQLPPSLLFYRALLQWLGGIGIVVIALAILPMLGVGGMQMFRAETPGPVKDTKIAPRITDTAKTLFKLYVALTLLCALAYILAGMTPFDAICHAFATVAIGGFSTHDASLGYYEATPAVMLVATVFMFISAINFVHHFHCWSDRKIEHYWRDPETAFFGQVMIAIVVICCLGLLVSGEYQDWFSAISHGVFQAVSITTTTGFTSANYSAWPGFLPILLLFSSFMGGCVGSTAGGIKAIRILLIVKQGLRELAQLVHPNAVIPLKLGKQRVPAKVVSAVWSFFAVYVGVFMLVMLLLMATGLDYLTAFSATGATLNNLGPGLGDVALHYQNISDPAKIILCWSMLVGRLEVFTLLVLFTPMFWRR